MVTDAQIRYLQRLGVGKNMAASMTKAAATEKITELVRVKESEAPTAPQLQLLEVSMLLPSYHHIQVQHAMHVCLQNLGHVGV